MAQSRGYDGVPTRLYGLVLFLAAFMFVTSLGGGLFGQPAGSEYHRLTLTMFHPLCHQLPERGLLVQGTPTAVCSRCLGVYGGLWSGLGIMGAMVAAFAVPLRRRAWAVKAIIVALGLIAFDVVGNALNLWTNTHLSRILTGVLLGLSLSWLLAGELEFNKNQKD